MTIWATEIGYETRPEERLGISYAMQARYLAESLNALRSDARVKVGIWFTFRDNLASNLWTSGVYKQSGAPKPSLARFTAIARRIEIPGP